MKLLLIFSQKLRFLVNQAKWFSNRPKHHLHMTISFFFFIQAKPKSTFRFSLRKTGATVLCIFSSVAFFILVLAETPIRKGEVRLMKLQSSAFQKSATHFTPNPYALRLFSGLLPCWVWEDKEGLFPNIYSFSIKSEWFLKRRRSHLSLLLRSLRQLIFHLVKRWVFIYNSHYFL